MTARDLALASCGADRRASRANPRLAAANDGDFGMRGASYCRHDDGRGDYDGSHRLRTSPTEQLGRGRGSIPVFLRGWRGRWWRIVNAIVRARRDAGEYGLLFRWRGGRGSFGVKRE